MNKVVYLDHHATTPVDPLVFDKMAPFFTEEFGNAASIQHRHGVSARFAVDAAREDIANCIGALPSEIIFTSGATEATNLALLGTMRCFGPSQAHMITTQADHRASLDTCFHLANSGYEGSVITTDRFGCVNAASVESSIRPNTRLVSVIHANNEIGSINPIQEIGELLRDREIIFHVDSAQAAGRMPIDVGKMNVDLLSFSGHKIYGPKGIGVLFARSNMRKFGMEPIMHGGGHELGLRSGTLNVPGIVGISAALVLACALLQEENSRIGRYRDKFEKGLVENIPDVAVNGHPTSRLANNLSVTFKGVLAEDIMAAMPDFALSSGSACSSASIEPSHVLRAIGLPQELALSTIRIGLGRFNTEEDIDNALERFVQTIPRLRK